MLAIYRGPKSKAGIPPEVHSYCAQCLMASGTAIPATVLTHLGKIQVQYRSKSAKILPLCLYQYGLMHLTHIYFILWVIIQD